MRHCPSCQINYNGELDRCALCGTTLTGTPSPSPFPHIPLKKVSKRARRILAASTLALLIAWIVACIALNLPWTVCVAASVALVLNYLFIRNIMTHSPNTLRAIKRYFLVVMAMALLWFFATGSSVVSSYVIPIISLGCYILRCSASDHHGETHDCRIREIPALRHHLRSCSALACALEHGDGT